MSFLQGYLRNIDYSVYAVVGSYVNGVLGCHGEQTLDLQLFSILCVGWSGG